jgi:hypothetical protein
LLQLAHDVIEDRACEGTGGILTLCSALRGHNFSPVTDDGEEKVDGDPELQSLQVIMDPSQFAGAWANFARVSHSEHEFTIDFIRIDSTQVPPRGIVVSRVSVSPLFVTQLIDALNENWTKYARKALPKEVHGDDD